MKKNFLFIAVTLFSIFLFSGCIQQNGIESECLEDSDCFLAIRLDSCCPCPESFHKSVIESRQNLVEYEPGRDYTQKIKVDCTDIECDPCPLLEQMKVKCINKKCETVIEEISETCKTLKEKISEEIEKLNYCETKEDCITKNFECPFGCNVLVNKNSDFTKTNALLKEYIANCPECVYYCAKPRASLDCVENKCVPVQGVV